MSIDWASEVERFFGDMPHPQVPQLRVREVPQAVKMATKARYGGHATFQEAAAFWSEYNGMNAQLEAQGKAPFTPEEFEHQMERMAPVSFAYHGRPPTMQEMAQHREASPAQVRQYYGDLPDKHYPDVTASQMAKMLALAEAPAQQHIQRMPNKLEGRTFAHAGMGYDAIVSFYRQMGQEKNGSQDRSGGDAGDAGAAAPGGQQDDPRASGPGVGRTGPPPGGQDGLPQG